MPAKIPAICDYDCPHADFPPAETAGLCHTMSAVWCRKLKELAGKNTPCAWKKRQADARATAKKTPPKKRAGAKKAARRTSASRRRR